MFSIVYNLLMFPVGCLALRPAIDLIAVFSTLSSLLRFPTDPSDHDTEQYVVQIWQN